MCAHMHISSIVISSEGFWCVYTKVNPIYKDNTRLRITSVSIMSRTLVKRTSVLTDVGSIVARQQRVAYALMRKKKCNLSAG